MKGVFVTLSAQIPADDPIEVRQAESGGYWLSFGSALFSVHISAEQLEELCGRASSALAMHALINSTGCDAHLHAEVPEPDARCFHA